MPRVWITDGSVPVFDDTLKLRASHKGLFGLPVRYEGFVDPSVPRGNAEVAGERADDALFAEAEWYLEFAEGIDDYLDGRREADEATPIVLHGLIEGKWFNRLLGTRAWKPASLGNNVVSDGEGISTTLGALETSAAGETRLEYRVGDGRQVHTTRVADLRGHNIADLVRDVLRVCREEGEALDGIDLGAVGEQAAVVNERARLRASLRGDRLPLPNPLNMAPHRAKERLVRGALADGIAVPPAAPVELTTVDGSGRAVGRATLTWRR